MFSLLPPPHPNRSQKCCTKALGNLGLPGRAGWGPRDRAACSSRVPSYNPTHLGERRAQPAVPRNGGAAWRAAQRGLPGVLGPSLMALGRGIGLQTPLPSVVSQTLILSHPPLSIFLLTEGCPEIHGQPDSSSSPHAHPTPCQRPGTAAPLTPHPLRLLSKSR